MWAKQGHKISHHCWLLTVSTAVTNTLHLGCVCLYLTVCGAEGKRVQEVWEAQSVSDVVQRCPWTISPSLSADCRRRTQLNWVRVELGSAHCLSSRFSGHCNTCAAGHSKNGQWSGFQPVTRGPMYKMSCILSWDYLKFIVRSTYDSYLWRATISLRNNIVS